uniref:Autophagy-related protein 9 n=1 Tax=viral metagenome TaxID=1070528 RepID=A0A6C0BM03_9ZZZZ
MSFSPGHLTRDLRRIYHYYVFKGFANLVLIHLMGPLITLVLTGFFILLSGVQFRCWPWWAWCVLGGASIIWIGQMIFALYQMMIQWRIKRLYQNVLKIEPSEMETITWDAILFKLLSSNVDPKFTAVSAPAPKSPVDVMACLTRQENYLVAMINKGIIDPPRSDLTEWLLRYVIFHVNWTEKGVQCLDLEPHLWAKRLQRAFVIMSLLVIICLPMVVAIQVFRWLLRYGSEIRSNWSDLLQSRTWTREGQWKLREINEAPHIFHQRLRVAHHYADRYVKQFPLPSWIMIVANTIIYLIGLTCVLYGVMAFGMFHSWIYWGSVSFAVVLSVLVTVIGICNSLLPGDQWHGSPRASMLQTVQYTHYLPHNWKHREHTVQVKWAFQQLFDLKVKYWLREVIATLLAPWTCMFIYVRRAGQIAEFMSKFTVIHPVVGPVCAYSMMQDCNFCTPKYGGLVPVSKDQQLHYGKMEKSILNLCLNYPSWTPPDTIQMMIHRIQEWGRSHPAVDDSVVSQSIYVTINQDDDMALGRQGRMNAIHDRLHEHYRQQQSLLHPSQDHQHRPRLVYFSLSGADLPRDPQVSDK